MKSFTILLAIFCFAATVSSDTKKEPWELTSPGDELKQLQGDWVVNAVQHRDDTNAFSLPKETGLTEERTRLVIRGNELLRDDKVIATLANDLSAMGLESVKGAAAFRRPLLITLPDGRAFLCAYDKRHFESVDIAGPGVGNVGRGLRVYLGRPGK